MTSLLTLNGVPPQIIGSLTQEERQNLITCSQSDGRWDFFSNDCREFSSIPDSKPVLPHIEPFKRFATGMAERFIRWGAKSWFYVSNERDTSSHHDVHSSVGLISKQLEAGQSTFNGRDLETHSDSVDALELLHSNGRIGVRLLCVSSNPAEFVNVTSLPRQRSARKLLARHRRPPEMYKGRLQISRFYEPSLLEWALAHQAIVKPEPWDVMAFDWSTPHRPIPGLDPHRRIFQQAWLFFQLPTKWENRVARGDVPRWTPTLG